MTAKATRKRKVDPTGKVDLLAQRLLKGLVESKVTDPVLVNLYRKWEPQINLCLSDLLKQYNVAKEIRKIGRYLDAGQNT